jgi:hypothetical protein
MYFPIGVDTLGAVIANEELFVNFLEQLSLHLFWLRNFERIKRGLLPFYGIAIDVKNIFEHFKSGTVQKLFGFENITLFV